MTSSYLLIGVALFITLVIYKLFISFFVDYLIAGFKLGFDKIAMVYWPLSSYAAIYKYSLKKYKNSMGHFHQIIKKKPEVKIIFVRVLGVNQLVVVDP